MRKVGKWYLIAGGLMVGTILFIALFAEQLTSVSPYYYHTKASILEGTAPFPPGPGMPLGTDQLGRDVWSRIAFGARWSLLFAFAIMGFRLLLALPMALICTFGPKWVNWVLGRLYVFTSAVPPLLVYVLLLTSPGFRLVGLTKSLTVTITMLTLMEWPRIAVMLRGRLEEISLEPYIEGAVAVGATRSQIFWSHMLPHLWPTLMQVMTAEMGRALMNIAQLGFFGIWVGGGMLEVDYSDSGASYKVSISVPEWGTLLAGAKEYVRTAPWIPIAPATAFFLGILGFNLLSQGLDRAIISVSALRFRLPERVRRSLPVAVAAAVIAGLLLYHRGLPWGHTEQIKALAAYQELTVQENNVEEYLATFLDEPGLRAEQRGWLEGLAREDLQSVMIFPSDGKLSGGKGSALFTIVLGYRSSPAVVIPRSVNLVRRGNRWYDAGEALSDFRGLHSVVRAYYDPIAPGLDVADTRYRVNVAASVIDHGYNRAVAAVPWTVDEGQRIAANLYPSHQSYINVVRGLGAEINPEDAPVWLSPDGELHISWNFVARVNRKPMQQMVAFEALKLLMQDRAGSAQLLPLLAGYMEIDFQRPNPYELFVSQLAGQQFYELDELFAVAPERLSQSQRPVYSAQGAVLVQFLEERLSADRVRGLVESESGDALEMVARELGVSRTELSAAYREYLFERLAARSVLNLPAGRARVPDGLLAALQSRESAVPGAKYEATLLDLTEANGRAQVTVLERYTGADGTTAFGITAQEWDRAQESWTPGTVIRSWTPEGGMSQ